MENKIKINDHHNAPTCHGYTDIAAFTLMVCHDDGRIAYVQIRFSGDGANKVYIADQTKNEIAVPDYYQRRDDVGFSRVYWFAIYDDENRICKSENYHGETSLRLFEKGRSAILLITPNER